MASSQAFSLSELTLHFDRCRAQQGLALAEYCDGYEQLLHFLRSLNKTFYFVVQDVDSKLRILRGHLAGHQADRYATISGMLEFESVAGFAADGSRTLLRLHRALSFLVLLLERLVGAEASQTTASIAGGAYNETLAQHHTWAVRKAVSLALYLLPSRESLLAAMARHNCCDAAEVRRLVDAAVPVLRNVYDSTCVLYEAAGALSLP